MRVFLRLGMCCLGLAVVMGLLSGAALAADAPRTHLFICSGQSNMVGLELSISFIPTLKEAYPKDEIIVVKDAESGQPIKRWYKNYKTADGTPVPNSGDLYDRLMAKVKPAIEGKQIATVTFVWMQGESDAIDGRGVALHGPGDVYAASLRGLIDQLAGDLKRTDLNVVIGRISSKFSDDPTRPDWDIVRKAQVSVAESNPRARWVNTDDLNGPDKGIHYTAEGYKELGRRFAVAAIDIINKPPKSSKKTPAKPAK